MKRVFSTLEISEAILVRDALLQAGIEAMIENQNTSFSAIPGLRAPAEIWIRDDGRFEAARKIVTQTVTAIDDPSEQATWTCKECGEANPVSFDVCWNCQREA